MTFCHAFVSYSFTFHFILSNLYIPCIFSYLYNCSGTWIMNMRIIETRAQNLTLKGYHASVRQTSMKTQMTRHYTLRWWDLWIRKALLLSLRALWASLSIWYKWGKLGASLTTSFKTDMACNQKKRERISGE